MPASLLDHVRLMARNNAWANDRLHAACCQLSDDEFAATRVSFFPSLQLTLNHILIVDRNYLDDMTGRGRSVFKTTVIHPRAPDLAREQAATDRALVAFCDGLAAADLDRVVKIDRRDGVDYRERIAAILAHLFQHQIHHRGQAHAMLAGTRIEPPQLDEFLLDSDRARRAADLQRLRL
jgi:uncharacterized damage-inducible protein DinB